MVKEEECKGDGNRDRIGRRKRRRKKETEKQILVN